MKTTHWRLKPKMDRRFRSGHPWVYSNELMESPKGVEPGAPIELSDAGGKFLARGYGNPSSLIAFRALTRNPEDQEPWSADGIHRRIAMAGELRARTGLGDFSHRMVFGEGDELPGLIVDRFLLKNGQVFVVQAHTAGMDRVLPEIFLGLEKWTKTQGKIAWEKTAIVLRNDLGVRKLEGLEPQDPKVVKEVPGLNLRDATLILAPALPGKIDSTQTEFSTDLLEGQKTGFFLDQWANIQLACQRFQSLKPVQGTRIRILDLCCYVGQWSTHLTKLFRAQGLQVEVTLVDASKQALDFASRNVERQGGKVEKIEGDVLRDLLTLEDRSFDLVISDPPAFIKGRKDVPQGTHAYLQLNTQAIRLVRDEGALVACSCSALFEENSFVETLAKAARRNSRRIQWVGRGAQSPDHPILAEFPEGQYLKAWVGWVRK